VALYGGAAATTGHGALAHGQGGVGSHPRLARRRRHQGTSRASRQPLRTSSERFLFRLHLGDWDDDPSAIPPAYQQTSRFLPVPRLGTKFPEHRTLGRSAFHVTKDPCRAATTTAEMASCSPSGAASACYGSRVYAWYWAPMRARSRRRWCRGGRGSHLLVHRRALATARHAVKAGRAAASLNWPCGREGGCQDLWMLRMLR